MMLRNTSRNSLQKEVWTASQLRLRQVLEQFIPLALAQIPLLQAARLLVVIVTSNPLLALLAVTLAVVLPGS